MKTVAIAIAALVLASAGAAAAQDQVSDQTFLQASRCKGIALGLGADATAVRRFVNMQSQSRADMILHKGQAEAGQGQRDAANPAKKEQLAAELSGACAAFMGAPGVMAKGGGQAATAQAVR